MTGGDAPAPFAIIFEIFAFLIQKFKTVKVRVILERKSWECQHGTSQSLAINFWMVICRLQAARWPNTTAKTQLLHCSDAQKSVLQFFCSRH